MSSHHTKHFIIRHYKQVADALCRRETRQQLRQYAFELQRQEIREQVDQWMISQWSFALFWLFGIIGISLIYLFYQVGR